jgi:hypothetical protein
MMSSIEIAEATNILEEVIYTNYHNAMVKARGTDETWSPSDEEILMVRTELIKRLKYGVE